MSIKNGNIPTSSDTSDLDDLAKRLSEAKGESDEFPVEDHDGSLLGIAWRISTELVVAVLVGTALGYGLDYLTGTRPIFTLVGLVFGTATGMRNTFRLVAKMEKEELERLERQNKS